MKKIIIESIGGMVDSVYCDEESTYHVYEHDELSEAGSSAAVAEIREAVEDGRLFRSKQADTGAPETLEDIVGNLLAELPDGLFRDDDDEEGNEVNGGDLVDIMTTYARRLQAVFEGRKQ